MRTDRLVRRTRPGEQILSMPVSSSRWCEWVTNQGLQALGALAQFSDVAVGDVAVRCGRRSPQGRAAVVEVGGAAAFGGDEVGDGGAHGGFLDAEDGAPQQDADDCHGRLGVEGERGMAADRNGDEGAAADVLGELAGGHGRHDVGDHGGGVDDRNDGRGDDVAVGEVEGQQADGGVAPVW